MLTASRLKRLGRRLKPTRFFLLPRLQSCFISQRFPRQSLVSSAFDPRNSNVALRQQHQSPYPTASRPSQVTQRYISLPMPQQPSQSCSHLAQPSQFQHRFAPPSISQLPNSVNLHGHNPFLPAQVIHCGPPLPHDPSPIRPLSLQQSCRPTNVPLVRRHRTTTSTTSGWQS